MALTRRRRIAALVDRADLKARAPELARTHVWQIPNPVDIAGIRRAAEAAPRPLGDPYALYVGQLEPNKGAGHLIDVARLAPLRWPLVVVGDGRLRASLESEAAAAGVDLRVQGWLPRDQALDGCVNASVLVFPSHGPESLRPRVLEARPWACPSPPWIPRRTRDIVIHDAGLLSDTAQDWRATSRGSSADRPLAARLAKAHACTSERTFDAPAVIARIEHSTLMSSRIAESAWLIRSTFGHRARPDSFYGLHAWVGSSGTSTISFATIWQRAGASPSSRERLANPPALTLHDGASSRIIRPATSVSWSTARSRLRAESARRFWTAARHTPGLAGVPAA